MKNGQHIVAYRQQLADRHAARPSSACISYLPRGQLMQRTTPRRAARVLQTSQYAQFGANAQDW